MRLFLFQPVTDIMTLNSSLTFLWRRKLTQNAQEQRKSHCMCILFFKVHFVALVISRENSCNSILAQWRNIQITNQHIPPYLAVTIFNHEWYLAITGRLGFGYIIIPPSRRLQYERVNDMSVLFTILRKWRYLAYFRFTK